MAPRRRVDRTRAVVLPSHWRLGTLPRLRDFVPSARSILLGFLAAAIGFGLYAGARYTPVFAIRAIEVRGLPSADAARVRGALDPLLGTSLVGLDANSVVDRLVALPEVAGARYDRAFPHTLRVVVVPERPVALVRQRRTAWLVSARARVIRSVPLSIAPDLPRIWLPGTVAVTPGDVLSPGEGGTAARALALVRANRFPYAVRAVRAEPGALALMLRTGVRIELGTLRDEPLKLAIARRALPLLPPATTYLDVSVPARPVSGGTLDSQVEVKGCCPSATSTSR
jgi:cell division protein FtsQ